jgi:branched-subunit amino acid aminotransferase/4-amino-4-deoxychorismate lyase
VPPSDRYRGPATVPPSDRETVLRWSENELRDAADEPPAALLAADSWLVADGAVRALDAHWARFGGWCAELGVAIDELARFRASSIAALPRGHGRWFPRVEVVGGSPPALRLRLRPAPPAATVARVLVAPPGDPRTRPRWKGPDLECLIALRAQAGADELLLCHDDGRLLEGALSSLLWWEGDVLCTTPDERTLPGVTRALLLAAARRAGVELRVRSPRPEELAGCETWLTSALHGIRAVEGWGPAVRAAPWRAELERSARPLRDERWV